MCCTKWGLCANTLDLFKQKQDAETLINIFLPQSMKEYVFGDCEILIKKKKKSKSVSSVSGKERKKKIEKIDSVPLGEGAESFGLEHHWIESSRSERRVAVCEKARGKEDAGERSRVAGHPRWAAGEAMVSKAGGGGFCVVREGGKGGLLGWTLKSTKGAS